ncbi:MAG: amidase [Bryobacterales bacterium]|nr:amidase [Bryobacterales bacterium]
MGGQAKRILKWAGFTTGTVALVGGGLGAYLYTQKPKPIGERPVLQAGLFHRPAQELPVERRFLYASAGELSAMIRNRKATSEAIVQTHINFIKNNNYKTNAFVWLFEEEALGAAKAADEKIARGEPTGLLHGVPVSVKEEFWVKGKPNTWNAEMFQGVKAPRNGEVVDALIEQGAIIVGTTNVPAMLADLQTIGEIYPTANNPYDPGRTPGGSTGGGAASVAAGMVPIALGGDMGGSIRVPAAFNGLYGLKTTEGATRSESMEFPGKPGNPKYRRMMVAGPLARSVGDLDLAWNALMAKWPDRKQRMLEPKTKLDDYSVAFFDEWTFRNDRMFVGQDVKLRLASLAAALESKHVMVRRDQPAGFEEMMLMHRLLSIYLMFERVPWLIRQYMVREYRKADSHRFQFAEVLDRMSDLDPEKYDDLLRRRQMLTDRLESFFGKYDLLLMPVTPGPAIPHNPNHGTIALDGKQINYWDYFYYPMCFNVTGHPALTIPLGLNREGLPIAIQVVGPLYSERRLIEFARLIEPLHTGFATPPSY